MIDDARFRREVLEIKQGGTYAAGTFTLSVSSTSTTVNKRGVSSNSAVNVMALSSTSAQSDITRVVPATDLFVVTHNSSSVSTRTFRYNFVTPQ